MRGNQFRIIPSNWKKTNKSRISTLKKDGIEEKKYVTLYISAFYSSY